MEEEAYYYFIIKMLKNQLCLSGRRVFYIKKHPFSGVCVIPASRMLALGARHPRWGKEGGAVEGKDAEGQITGLTSWV